MKPKDNSAQPNNQFYWIGLICIIVALIVSVIPAIILRWYAEKWEIGFASNLGDFVGGVGGALLSFAGLMLLMQTILEQRRDYKVAQDNLQEQIVEIREMKRIHEEQQFEVTFFQALNGHNELVKHFKLPSPLGNVEGKACMQQLYAEFERHCRQGLTEDQIIAAYLQFADKNRLILRQFIQSIEKVLSYTHLAEVSEKVKVSLLGFISAQLTYHEEFFLLLHLSSKPALQELAQFTKQFDIFDCQAEPPFEALNQTPLFTP